MLSVAVRERDFVVGKFVGVWFAMQLVVALSLASCGLALAAFAPAALDALRNDKRFFAGGMWQEGATAKTEAIEAFAAAGTDAFVSALKEFGYVKGDDAAN